MDEKRNFFIKLEGNGKQQILFFLMSMLTLFALYLPSMYTIHTSREVAHINELNKVVDYEVLSSINVENVGHEEFVFSGWICKLNCQSTNINLVLQETESFDAIILKTELQKTNEMPKALSGNAGHSLDQCGFVTKEKKLDSSLCYELFAVIEYENQSDDERQNKVVGMEKVSTGKYLYLGELYSYNPLEYEKPSIEEKSLRDVIEKGILLAHDKEKQSWIYQYDSRMFWIIEFSNFGDVEERIEIPLFVYSVQVDEASNKVTIQRTYYSGYYLTEEDYLAQEKEQYFVYSLSMPCEDTIAYFETGVYCNEGDSKGWNWNAKISTDYEN